MATGGCDAYAVRGGYAGERGAAGAGLQARPPTWWSWMIEPAARMVFGLRGSCVSELPRKSNAL